MELLDVLIYNKEEGKLYWKVKVGPRALVGQEVGHTTKKGYKRFSYKGKDYFVHRVIWFIETGEWPKDQLDHDDRNPGNNRFTNLKECSNHMNSLNKESDKTSKFPGVSLNKGGKWVAFHFHNGKNNYLGQFDTEEEANTAYWDYVKRVRYG